MMRSRRMSRRKTPNKQSAASSVRIRLTSPMIPPFLHKTQTSFLDCWTGSIHTQIVMVPAKSFMKEYN